MKLAAAARALNSANGMRHAPFSLAFLTDRRRIAHPELVLRVLPPGAALIYRDYDDPRRAAISRHLATISKRRGVLFLLGADAALAEEVGADGVHLPARALSSPPVRCNARILTASCHNKDELQRAATAGAHIAFLGPVFATASHPDADYMGVSAFKSLARDAPLAVMALGGVTPGAARLLNGANIAGFGAIGAFSPD
ncbi:MAG: thiamine phosphate synthase [Parvularculaceae bacterium]|nr:thiamine phosphate synthase [Parvularculaceae bacterium]